MEPYQKPTVTAVGSLHSLTLGNATGKSGSGVDGKNTKKKDVPVGPGT